jgi:class 3 adenylate cyclase/tetratricopeptide (TPR) repeat protein
VSATAELRCAACGELTPPGKFCIHCGTPTQQACPACGQPVVPGAKFCLECGTALSPGAASPAPSSPAVVTTSERRLVSVLFADLVGFTTLSEHRDPEEVRELLSQYFDRCRTLIERYGGTVEKFIGDAVMAVWGTPVAREDDAERAVRAALSLTQAVTLLGEEVGMPSLRVRAGVLTGNAAVEVGAESEGMVLGDTVNTASRLQSIAAPGTVLVDDVTRRSSEAAIEYEDTGEHDVKGRDRPVRAWTALRVVAGVGGARRSAGLEATFVGRERELAALTDSFEDSAEQGRARLVTVVGEAGAGKSRLLWEFFKYMDGVERVVHWHQGRCLSYGDGVAYWALAEIVRARAGISEEEGPESARVKLHDAVTLHVSDEREQRLVEPRLAHLLGLEQRTASDRADLFSGWRLFFERMSEQAPVVLVFEDMQWADSGLLEFVDYLLEWAVERPLFVLALGRPELLASRPAWGDTAVTLGPLSDASISALLESLVPGVPEELAGRVLERAEGVPLYAVETVRMLLDRGLLAQDGNRYRVTGKVGELDVPETLHALAAARLDGLSPDERTVLQNAAVFGHSFTPAGVAAVSERSAESVTALLDGLVAKQVLGFNDDRLSAERGQYYFLQGLLRTTAYGTLSRRDRKNRHLAAARHLQEAWGEAAPELAEVLAAHFLDAAAADPAAADAPRIRAAACETLADAGKRALSLALGAEAQRAFDRAAELAEDDATHATLLDQAGRAAQTNGDHRSAAARLEQAVSLFDALGDPRAAARSLAALSHSLARLDRLDEAIELDRRAVAGLPEASAEQAAALAALAQHLNFSGDFDEALAATDAALAIAEPLRDWPTVVESFNALANVRQRTGRVEEASALRERALALALEHDLGFEALRTYNNLANGPLQQEGFREARDRAETGLALALARGDRGWERTLRLMIVAADVGSGHWADTTELSAEADRSDELLRLGYLPLLARVQAARGERDALQRTLERAAEVSGSSNSEFGPSTMVSQAIAHNVLGRPAEALAAAMEVAVSGVEVANEDRREAYLEAGIAALALDDQPAVERLIAFVAGLPPTMRSPLMVASAARFAGLLAQRRDDPETAERYLTDAQRELRGIEAPFILAQVLLEHAELRHAGARPDEADELLAEATEIFTRLRARPWLERARAMQGGEAVVLERLAD